MEDVYPSYYAVIPADVRYDDEIPPNAKLLYGEISALIGKDGFCYASNAYFMKLYEFSDPTVSRLLKQLEDAGYIVREQERDVSGKVVRRKIYLNVSAPEEQPPLKNNTPKSQYREGGGLKNEGYTNTSITNIKENKKEKTADYDPAKDFAVFVEEAFPEATWGDISFSKQALLEAFHRFAENRQAIKKPIKSKAAVTALANKLQKYAENSPRGMIDLLDTATASGWQSVYPPKQQARDAPQPKRTGRVYEDL